MLAHYLAVVDSFFASLPDTLISPKEATTLVNTQLVPRLAFRMTAHFLGHDQLVAIQNRVWAHYSRITKLPRHTPPKARFAPSQEGALGLFHLPTRLAALILAQYKRVLSSEGPTQANSIFLPPLRARRGRGENYSIAHGYSQAAEAIGCQVKGISPQTLLGQHFHPLRQPHPQGLPTDHLILHRVERGIHTHHYSHKPIKPLPADLSKHRCHQAAEPILRFPDADLGYTDGSHVHWVHSGCAAVLDNFAETGTIIHSMRVRESSSYPAELCAVYLVLVHARPSSTLIVLSNCSSALQKIAAIEQVTCAYYSHTHAHILRKISQALRSRRGPTHFAHIRSHVGFAGNEWADLFARRAAYVAPMILSPKIYLNSACRPKLPFFQVYFLETPVLRLWMPYKLFGDANLLPPTPGSQPGRPRRT